MTSILDNPDDDPHLFEASPATARALADARVVIVNGVDYDPWMEKLLTAHPAPAAKRSWSARSSATRPGDNPHLWYDPATVKAAGKALVGALVCGRPGQRRGLSAGPRRFDDSLKPLDEKIAAMKKAFAGQPVTASEPVFGYQADLIGLEVRTRNSRSPS